MDEKEAAGDREQDRQAESSAFGRDADVVEVAEAGMDSESATRCQNCGSKVFLVDETCTHVEIGGEIVKTHTGDLVNRNCIRCTYPDLYPDFREHDDE